MIQKTNLIKYLIDKAFICSSNNNIYVENVRKRTTFINNNWTLLVKIEKITGKINQQLVVYKWGKVHFDNYEFKICLTARD